MTETRIHRTGTPQPGHQMTVQQMLAFLYAVAYEHKGCSEVPDAIIEFPAGFSVTYASPKRSTLTP